jgi:hypothetical protein
MSQRRSLSNPIPDPFAAFEKPKQPEQPSNSVTEQLDVTVPRNTDTEPNVGEPADVATSIVGKYANRKGRKPAKQTIEDTHTRQTYLIRNDLISRLERLSKGQRRGFKTEFVNDALELLLAKAESAGE